VEKISNQIKSNQINSTLLSNIGNLGNLGNFRLPLEEPTFRPVSAATRVHTTNAGSRGCTK
jgi:hypothetical protein